MSCAENGGIFLRMNKSSDFPFLFCCVVLLHHKSADLKVGSSAKPTTQKNHTPGAYAPADTAKSA